MSDLALNNRWKNMNSTDLPQTFKRLHFLKLDWKSTGNSDTFKYDLKNHFNAVVAQINGTFLNVGGRAEDDCHIELAVSEQPKNLSKSDDNIAAKIFRLTIRKHEDGGGSNITDFDKINDNAPISLDCELLSDKGQILGRITVMKDTRSSTYSYEVLDDDEKGASLLQIFRRKSNENKCDVLINSLTSEKEGTELTATNNTIGRVNLENGKICLCMTPELSALTKFRLISIMILMEVVENRQQ